LKLPIPPDLSSRTLKLTVLEDEFRVLPSVGWAHARSTPAQNHVPRY
jgi:hypothetical protein